MAAICISYCPKYDCLIIVQITVTLCLCVSDVYDCLIIVLIAVSLCPCVPDAYDCAVMAGGMIEGHVPCSGLYQLARVVKPGKQNRSN